MLPSLCPRVLLATGVGLMSLMSQMATAQNGGPVRMARISYIAGKASWRPDEEVGWSRATVNLPVRQGAEVWLAPGSRVELQFDDGSTLRLGDDAVVKLQTLYSDRDGEFTEVKLTAGTSSWHLKDKYSIYQVDTPDDSVKSAGPCDFRVDVRSSADSVAVRRGMVTLTADDRDTQVPAGDYVVMHDPDDPVRVRALGAEDSWDRFNDSRNVVLEEEPAHVPSDIGLVAGGLDRHGHWYFTAGYGWVWSPYEEAGWAPYHRGHWVWVDPFGWTWVSEDPWGWAPYHYGTWAHFGFGWGWVPGPAVQYWSPARVDFVDEDGYVCWAPLAPEEVVYPAFSIGFGSGNWWFNFSIGGCAVYEPFGPAYCEPVVYPALWFGPAWHRHGWDPDVWDRNRFARNEFRFVPRNAAFGAVGVPERSFGSSGRFDVVNRNARELFRTRSQAVAAHGAFSGPVNVRPTRTAFSPSHSLASAARPAALNRAVYRAPVGRRIAAAGGSFGPQVRGARTIASGARGPIGAAARPGAPNGARSLSSNLRRSNGPRVGIGPQVNVSRIASTARPPAGVLAARKSLGFRGRTGALTRGGGSARSATQMRVSASGKLPGTGWRNNRIGGSTVAPRQPRGSMTTTASRRNAPANGRPSKVGRAGGNRTAGNVTAPRHSQSVRSRTSSGQVARSTGGRSGGNVSVNQGRRGGGSISRGGGGRQIGGGGGQARGGGGRQIGGSGGQPRGGGGSNKKRGGGG